MPLVTPVSPAPPTAGPRSGPRGYALPEALCSLALFSTGLAALATLGPASLGWLRTQELLTHVTRAAVESAEAAEWPATQRLNHGTASGSWLQR